MDYVKVYLWQNEVTQLPIPKHSVRPVSVLPVVRRVVERAVTTAFNPVQLLGYFLERRSGDVLVDVLKLSSRKRPPSTFSPVVMLWQKYL